METAHHNPHRESIVNPADYTHTGCFYMGGSDEMYYAYQGEHRALNHRFGSDWLEQTSFHRNGGCAHCGAHFAHGALFTHHTHGLVAFGWQCAEERFTLDSNIALRMKLARTKAAKAAKRNRIRIEFAASIMIDPRNAWAFAQNHHIIRDIWAKGCQYGNVSDRQLDLVHRLATEKVQAAAQPEPETEPLPTVELSAGARTLVTGRVVSLKWKDSDFGGAWKILVEVEGGTRVYGTCPRNLVDDAGRGNVVRFTAKVEPSRNDPGFWIFKRPTKAELVTAA